MKALILSLGFLFLFSCSKIETGLKLAPRIVTSKIDDAFDFKSDKKAAIRSQIEKDIGLGKRPLAIALIEHIDALLALSKKDEVTSREIDLFIETLRKTQLQTIQLFKTSFETVLSDMQDEEVVYFKKHSDRKLKNDLEETTDRKDFLNARKNSIIKTYSFFFKNISDKQKKLTEDFVNRNYAYFVERIKIRKQFSDNFHLKLVAKEPTASFVMSYFGGGAKEFNQVSVKNYFEDFYKFQADFWNMTTQVEREGFRKTLNGYKDELKKIAGL